jgi:Bifunctional DNA primase/polymerase, N-terminal
MTPLEAALAWIQRGYSPIPVPDRSKKPVLEGWQRLEITVDVAPNYFNSRSQNIGVLLGDKYGSIDVDCDCPEAIRAARELLPETGLIFGQSIGVSVRQCRTRRCGFGSPIHGRKTFRWRRNHWHPDASRGYR